MLRWSLLRMTRQLWFRASLIGSLGIAAAILAAIIERFIPWQLPTTIGADAVDGILGIIASSMLAVTTFSLSVMTAAYGSATNSVTPRATKLLMEDSLTQNVLSTFIGSFLFSIVSIIVLKTGMYGERGRFILFIMTIAVIALIVVSLLRWIDYLTKLGRVGETINRVEAAARQAIEHRVHKPYLGAMPLTDPDRQIPEDAIAVTADDIGYVQHIDMSILSECCEQADLQMYITVIPGTFVYPDTPLGWVHGVDKDKIQTAIDIISKTFIIGTTRSFEQDPRFGITVMCEVASRALSPATNDAGTAIDIINRLTRLLALWSTVDDQAKPQTPEYPRLHVAPIRHSDMFEDAFMILARDGAGLVEIQLRLQKALKALSRIGNEDFRQSAIAQAHRAYARAEKALVHEIDKERLHAEVPET